MRILLYRCSDWGVGGGGGGTVSRLYTFIIMLVSSLCYLFQFCFYFSDHDGWEVERFGYRHAQLATKLRVLKVALSPVLTCSLPVPVCIVVFKFYY